jgi:hypothetical protein
MFAARQGFYPVATGFTPTVYTFTAFGSAAVTTTTRQFGAGSVDLVANTKYLSISNYQGPWISGTGDFCAEGWINMPTARSNVTTGDVMVYNITTGTGGFGLRFGNGFNTASPNYISIFARAQGDFDNAPFTWPRDTWCHFAAQRRSGTISFWANGNRLTRSNGPSGTAASRNFAAVSGNYQLTIGSYDSGGGAGSDKEMIQSYLDELRVSSTWRYDDANSTYTIPTSAFSYDANTLMLIHFDTNLSTSIT